VSRAEGMVEEIKRDQAANAESVDSEDERVDIEDIIVKNVDDLEEQKQPKLDLKLIQATDSD